MRFAGYVGRLPQLFQRNAALQIGFRDSDMGGDCRGMGRKLRQAELLFGALAEVIDLEMRLDMQPDLDVVVRDNFVVDLSRSQRRRDRLCTPTAYAGPVAPLALLVGPDTCGHHTLSLDSSISPRASGAVVRISATVRARARSARSSSRAGETL